MTDRTKIIDTMEQVKDLLLNNSPIDETLLNNLDYQLNKILKTPQPNPNDFLQGKTVRIWTDGACRNNPGPGGWAAIIETENSIQEFSGASLKTTNNIMEMTGALEGIKKTPVGSKIVLTTDSQYLVKGMTQWLKGWKKRGWKKADGKAVLNQDLWMKLDHEASQRTIEWVWIKGHAGHPENERCDELAREAISLL